MWDYQELGHLGWAVRWASCEARSSRRGQERHILKHGRYCVLGWTSCSDSHQRLQPEDKGTVMSCGMLWQDVLKERRLEAGTPSRMSLPS
jgi:hypothetical protein